MKTTKLQLLVLTALLAGLSACQRPPKPQPMTQAEQEAQALRFLGECIQARQAYDAQAAQQRVSQEAQHREAARAVADGIYEARRRELGLSPFPR